MPTHAPLQSKPTVKSQASFTSARTGLLQRKCSCSGNVILGGECDVCRGNRNHLQRKALYINEPADAFEQEADRMANLVVSKNCKDTAVCSQMEAGQTRLQRQVAQPLPGLSQIPDLKLTSPNSSNQAIGKIAEALLKTSVGKLALDKLDDAWERLSRGEKSVLITAGIATVATAVGGLAYHHQPLPIQPPGIPLGNLLGNGLTGHIRVEGPLSAPTFIGITVQLDLGNKKIQKKHGDAESLNRKSNQDAFSPDGIPAPQIVHEVLRSPGQPLDAETRAFMEPRFGHDFGNVRVHTGARATQSAKAINALAYTSGKNLVFGAGQFAPQTGVGRKLLAHELTHVIQQGQQSPQNDLAVGPESDGHELEAENVARAVTVGISTPVNPSQTGHGPMPLQRAPISGSAAAPVPPGWLGSLRAGAVHVKGNIWDVKVPSLGGDSWVGPYDELQAYINKQGFAGKMEAAHIVGGEHLTDIGSALPYEKAPCIAVDKSLHLTWTKQTTDLQKELGGRATRVWGRSNITHNEAIELFDDLYAAHPELREMARNIVRLPSRGVGGSLMPKPSSNMPKPTSPMEAKIPTMPKPTSPMEAQIPAMPKPTSPMEAQIPAMPAQIPETVPTVEVSRPPAIGESAIKMAVAEVALNVLLFAVTYYFEKWHAEKQLRKLKNDLEKNWPDINNQLKGKEAEIMEKAKAFPLVYGNITVFYTHDKYDETDYNEGSMSVQTVGISHQNYQVQEKLVKQHNVMEDNDSTYSLTFSVPLFEEKMAEKGASSLLGNYRKVREGLTDSGFKIRLQSAFTLHRLAKQDKSLENLVVRDLLGLLKDEDAIVRLTAANLLSSLKAKVAVPYILREALSFTTDEKKRELTLRALRELEQE